MYYFSPISLIKYLKTSTLFPAIFSQVPKTQCTAHAIYDIMRDKNITEEINCAMTKPIPNLAENTAFI